MKKEHLEKDYMINMAISKTERIGALTREELTKLRGKARAEGRSLRSYLAILIKRHIKK